MNASQLKHARRAREAGASYRSIARTLGVHESTVRRALKKIAAKKRRVTIIVIEEEV